MPAEMSQPKSSSGAPLRRSVRRKMPVPQPKSRRRPVGDRFLSSQSTLCSKNVSTLLPASRLSGSPIPPSYPAANASNSARGAGSGIVVTEVETLADQKQRTILRLLVDPADVLAHDPETDEGQAAERDDGHLEPHPATRHGNVMRVPFHERDGDVDPENHHGEHARPVEQPEREAAERDNGLDREPRHAKERILRLAGCTGTALLADDAAPEPEPAHHPADVPMDLAEVIERVDRAPAHEPEIAGVTRGARLSDPLQEAIECLGRPALEQRLAFSPFAHGIHDIGALLPGVDEIGHDFRRILEVGVERDDGVARGQPVATAERRLMSEVARKRHRPHARVRAREIDDLEPAAVDAAVVDHDDLDAEPLLALDAIGHGRELALQQRQALLPVEEREREPAAL